MVLAGALTGLAHQEDDAMPIWLPWLLLAAAEAFKVWVDEQRRS